MISQSDRLRRVAAFLEQHHGLDGVAESAMVLRGIADELPPEWPTGGDPAHLASLGLPEVMHPAVWRDLELVDSLEQRMRAMPMRSMVRPNAHAGESLAQLFAAARGTIVSWYAHQWHEVTRVPPSMIFTGKAD